MFQVVLGEGFPEDPPRYYGSSLHPHCAAFRFPVAGFPSHFRKSEYYKKSLLLKQKRFLVDNYWQHNLATKPGLSLNLGQLSPIHADEEVGPILFFPQQMVVFEEPKKFLIRGQPHDALFLEIDHH